MPDNQVSPVKRGGTYHGPGTSTISSTYGQEQDLEGRGHVFLDTDPSDTLVKRSNSDVYAILVRNVSGQTLLPKKTVMWAPGFRGTRVIQYAGNISQGDEPAGVIDDHLPTSGVRDEDMFWMIVKGPCLCITSSVGDAGNSISEGGILYAATAATALAPAAGHVRTWVGTFNATQTTDGTAVNIIQNKVGQAMSAKVTANTEADILVDVSIV